MPVPIPYGDPGAMRAYAGALKTRADRIGDVADSVYAKTTSIEFEGPAAPTYRATMAQERRNGHEIAQALQDLASDLIHAAAQLEEDINAAERFNREEAEHAKELARHPH